MRVFTVLLLILCLSVAHASTPVPIQTLIAGAANSSELVDVDPNGLIVVDFGYEGCAPCRINEPGIRTASRQYGATFVKVDIIAHHDLFAPFNEEGVPVYFIYLHGVVVERIKFDWYKTTETPEEAVARINAKFGPILSRYRTK